MKAAKTDAIAENERLALPAVARLVSLPATGIASLATTALVVRHLGAEHYGVVLLVATLVMLVPFADLGVGAFVTNAIAENPVGSSDASRALISAFRILTVSAGIVSAAALALTVTGAWGIVLNVSDDQFPSFNWAVFAVVAAFVLGLPFSIGQRAMIGAGRNALLVVFQAMGPFITLAGVAALVAVDAAPAFYPAMWPVGTFVSLVAALLWCHHARIANLPSLFRSLTTKVGPRRTGVIATAVPMFVIMVALPIAHQSGRVVLSREGTLEQLGDYAIVASLYLPALSVLSAMGLTLWRKFASQGRWDEVSTHASTRYLLIFGVLGCILGLALVVIGPAVVDIVSDGELKPMTFVYVGFALLLLAQALQLPFGMRMTDPQGLTFQAVCSVAMVAIALVGSIALTRSIGAAGPPLATAISVLVGQCLPYALYARRKGARYRDDVDRPGTGETRSRDETCN